MKALKRLLVLLAFVTVSATPALAQKIHAGSATGSYTNDFCPQVEQALKGEYFEHPCTTSEGTGDNVNRVLADPKDIGLGQFDIVAAREAENPGKLAVVNPNLGLECLYAVTTDDRITSLRGLSARMPVALPSAKSGSTATFQYLQTLDEGLGKMRQITHYGSAMEAVQAVINGDAVLAFFVQFPNTKNPVFKAINDAELHFVPVINRQILRREVAGQRVYQPQQVTVTPAGLLARVGIGKEAQVIDTACTPVVLFTGNPEQFPEGSTEREDQLDVVKALGKTQPPSSEDWKDVFKNTVAIGKEKIDGLIEKYSN